MMRSRRFPSDEDSGDLAVHLGKWTLPLLGVLILSATCCVEPAFAQPSSADESIEAAREGLTGPIRFPWYDGQGDRLQRVDVKPPRDVANRHSRWEAEAPRAWNMPDWFGPLLRVLGWTLLGLLVILLAVVLIRAFLLEDGGIAAVDAADGQTNRRGDADRVESLPFNLAKPRADLLDEARRCYEAGRYGQAIIYLYSYQLVQLDKHQLIRLTKGKTNRQYLREMRSQPHLLGLLESTMITFEDVFFGRHRLERPQFEACWNRMDEFHQQLSQFAG
jgi:hypothetical protein